MQPLNSKTPKNMPRWTPESREAQGQRIRRWQPWNLSTGPTSPEGKQRSSRNADKGQHRHKLKEIRALMKSFREALPHTVTQRSR